eukprot:2338230-Prymnesium_polylepis.1
MHSASLNPGTTAPLLLSRATETLEPPVDEPNPRRSCVPRTANGLESRMAGARVCACRMPAIRSRGHVARPILAVGPLKRSSWCRRPGRTSKEDEARVPVALQFALWEERPMRVDPSVVHVYAIARRDQVDVRRIPLEGSLLRPDALVQVLWPLEHHCKAQPEPTMIRGQRDRVDLPSKPFQLAESVEVPCMWRRANRGTGLRGRDIGELLREPCNLHPTHFAPTKWRPEVLAVVHHLCGMPLIKHRRDVRVACTA